MRGKMKNKEKGKIKERKERGLVASFSKTLCGKHTVLWIEAEASNRLPRTINKAMFKGW